MNIYSVSKRPWSVDDEEPGFDTRTFANAAKVSLAACLRGLPVAPGTHEGFRIDDAAAKSYSPLG
jgi:hypothetical protein